MLIVKRVISNPMVFYKVHVCIGNHTILTHIAFAFGRFFCKNVTFESFLKSNFTGTGYFKALLRWSWF